MHANTVACPINTHMRIYITGGWGWRCIFIAHASCCHTLPHPPRGFYDPTSKPIVLTKRSVDGIQLQGGTILGTSRGGANIRCVLCVCVLCAWGGGAQSGVRGS